MRRNSSLERKELSRQLGAHLLPLLPLLLQGLPLLTEPPPLQLQLAHQQLQPTEQAPTLTLTQLANIVLLINSTIIRVHSIALVMLEELSAVVLVELSHSSLSF